MNGILIKNATLVTLNQKRHIIKNGSIVIEGNRIINIDKDENIKNKYNVDQVIDGTNKVVMPGLINAHSRTAQAIIRGAAEDMTFPIPWLSNYVWPLEGSMTKDDMLVSLKLALIEMIKSGTTTFLDPLILNKWDIVSVANEVVKFGLRCVLAKSVHDIPTYAVVGHENLMQNTGLESEDKEESINLALNAKTALKDLQDKVQIWFGLTTPGGCSDSCLSELVDLSRKYKTGIVTNFAEEEEDVEYVKTKYGMSMLEYAKSHGLLGPNVILTHTIGISKDDFQILANTKTNVCTTPASEARFGPVTNAKNMIEAGVNLTLGTDGGIASNTYDMLREMRALALVNKVSNLPTVMQNETILECATINGAKALGWDNMLGSLEIGKKADLVVLDFNYPYTTPTLNILANIVHSSHSGNVHSVIIDGKLLVSDHKLVNVDEQQILDDAKVVSESLIKNANLINKIGPKWPLI
ncbi:MAG: amidohydrolase [Nitrososphaerota archaeon]|jgi:cytosine/adenosine deaminase-related metal-dependent hydrolase|nr:amidohydrolase [Nitrososphaerota archaeon]MDG7038960.1 amidohydrolase [Nitrososphaerota archaeon]MDG7041241.1 amidohydrolase [Nitrososphaerota archaeon]MDG7045917.1 amidohydrolase [Nitrososphaerota archaeon]